MSYVNKNQTNQQQIIFAEPASLEIDALEKSPELEVVYDQLSKPQQAMIDEALQHALAQAVKERLHIQAGQSIIRFNLQICDWFVQVNYKLETHLAQAYGLRDSETASRFIQGRLAACSRGLNKLGDQLEHSQTKLADKSLFPKFQTSSGSSFSFLNFKIFNRETTKISYNGDRDDEGLPALAGGTLFGNVAD